MAIARTLGFGRGQIYLAALCQSLLITVLGLLFALLISFTLLAWLPTVVPQINLSVHLYQFITIATLCLLVAILASLAAARTVAEIDPMTAFKS